MLNYAYFVKKTDISSVVAMFPHKNVQRISRDHIKPGIPLVSKSVRMHHLPSFFLGISKISFQKSRIEGAWPTSYKSFLVV